jgi:hypothetical protein
MTPQVKTGVPQKTSRTYASRWKVIPAEHTKWEKKKLMDSLMNQILKCDVCGQEIRFNSNAPKLKNDLLLTLKNPDKWMHVNVGKAIAIVGVHFIELPEEDSVNKGTSA